MKPRFITEQKITAFVNKYAIYDTTENGDKAKLRAFAQQKRLAFKEKVLFYSDESKSAVSFSFRAEKVFDVHGRYLVEDPEGNLLGMFQKQFGRSLFISTWKVLSADGTELFMVQESNVVLAVLRRFVGWIPFIGDIFELVILFFRYHFQFLDITSNQEVGKYQKTTLLRDHYRFEMTDEAFEKCDWRVLAAIGVGLDALQSR